MIRNVQSCSLMLALLFLLWDGTRAQSYCSPGQDSIAFDLGNPEISLTLYYTVDPVAKIVSGQLVYAGGQAWTALGVSPNGGMVGATSLIGLPAEPLSVSNPGLYLLDDRTIDQVLPVDPPPAIQPNNIAQNSTHTVLSFQIPLVDAPTNTRSLEILSNGNTNILVAVGFENALAFHRFRQNTVLTLQPCATAAATEAAATVTPATTPPTSVIPSTTVPATMAPSTIVPGTTLPVTTIPSTVFPSTALPGTVVPSTIVPGTIVPGTTVAPTAVAPATVIPSTVAPATVIPATAAPASTPPVTSPPQQSTETLPPIVYAVGTNFATWEGFVMDNFCIQRTTLLDNASVFTLEKPNLHSVHCLIDVRTCLTSGFEILLDPQVPGGSYQRLFTLDAVAKAQVVELAKTVGDCSTCYGTGQLKRGFRVRLTNATVVTATDITTGVPSTISVSQVSPVYYFSDASTEVNLQVGDFITAVGYIMDRYCIDLTYLLEAPELPTLENPALHTLHCLIDVPECGASAYELLLAPTPGSGSTQYKRGFVLDQASKDYVLSLAKFQGQCETCTGDGDWERGFRVEIRGQVTALGDGIVPPTVTIDSALTKRLEDLEQEQIQATEAPTDVVVVMNDTLDESMVVDDVSDPCGLPYRGTHALDGLPLTFNYTITYDEAINMGSISAEVVYNGTGWVGFGFSDSPEMVGATAVIGRLDQSISVTNPGMYNLDGKSLGAITQSANNTLLHASLRYDNTRTVLSFTKLLEEPGHVSINLNGTNHFLVAAGEGTDAFLYHKYRGAVVVPLPPPCETGDDVLASGASCDGNSTACYIDIEEPETPAQCSRQTSGSYVLENTPLVFNYEIDDVNGMLTGQVIYGGLGWVSFGISPNGMMEGSLAVIGLPSQAINATNPGFYSLNGKTPSAVALMSPQPTILNGGVYQNATHTSMVFSIPFAITNNSALSIDPWGNNVFLMAGGFDNNLLGHSYRGSFNLDFSGCAPAYSIGQRVSIEGFIVDRFCIELGYFLDNVNVSSLEEPNLHSLHCLLDVPQCNSSSYEILLDPGPAESLYRRGFTLDEQSKARIMTLAREIGTCNTCAGDGRLERGFRVKVEATVLDLGNPQTGAPPTISVTEVTPVLYITDTSTRVGLRVGDTVALESYVMDNYCLNLGVLLENQTIVTLQEPNRHSVHCLIDVEVCRLSPYEILLDPGPGVGMYGRGFQLDDSSKAMVTDLAKRTGVCSNCTGEGTLVTGFRIKTTGKLLDLGIAAGAGRALQEGRRPIIWLDSAAAGGIEVTNDVPPPTPPPNTPPPNATTGDVNCTQYQSTYSFPSIPITMHYVATLDEQTGHGNFSAQVVYEGKGWVGFAVSPTGFMSKSQAVIGLPDEPTSQSNPGKYFLGERTLASVTESSQQTLMDSSIVQNETHTVLTFTRALEEPDEMPSINPNGANYFLVAAGTGNSLATHRYRDSVRLTLSPCTANGTSDASPRAEEVDIPDPPSQTLILLHGIFAGIAWAILSPVAIGASLTRHLIPKQGLWFDIHRYLNTSVVVLTVLAFALAFSAIGGAGLDHFESLPGATQKHKTIGLVVFVLVPLQAGGGFLRPHAPAKDGNGKEIEQPSDNRVIWETLHKTCGFALLGLAFYQVHSGLVRYAELYSSVELWWVFWLIASLILLPALGAYAYKQFMDPSVQEYHENNMVGKDKEDGAEEQPLNGDNEDAVEGMNSDEEKPSDPESQLFSIEEDTPTYTNPEDAFRRSRRKTFSQSVRGSISSMSFRSNRNLNESKSGDMASQRDMNADGENNVGDAFDDEDNNNNNDGNEDVGEEGGNKEVEEEEEKQGGFFGFLGWGKKKEEEPKAEPKEAEEDGGIQGGETNALLEKVEEGDEDESEVDGSSNHDTNKENAAAANNNDQGDKDDNDGDKRDTGENFEDEDDEAEKKDSFLSKFRLWGGSKTEDKPTEEGEGSHSAGEEGQGEKDALLADRETDNNGNQAFPEEAASAHKDSNEDAAEEPNPPAKMDALEPKQEWDDLVSDDDEDEEEDAQEDKEKANNK